MVEPILANPPEPLIVHLDMDAFFASIEQQMNPHLRGRPIFVTGNRTTRTVVATASYEARRFGVKTGMALGQARRLCPQAVTVPGDPARYADTSHQIFSILRRYTDRFEIFSIDEAFLDITQTARFFGGPLAVAQSIKNQIRRQFGLSCSIGIAPNKLIAKLASDLQKPDGLVWIHPDEVAPLLEELPVEELCGIGARTAEKLRQWGVTTCGQLSRLPEGLLIERFGVVGSLLHQMGQGRWPDPVRQVGQEDPPKSMGHSHTLEADTENPQLIRAAILTLAEKVGRRLREARLAGRVAALTLRYKDFTTLTHHQTLPEPVDEGTDIYKICLRLAEKKFGPLRQPVRLVGVSMAGLLPQRPLTLFEEWNRRRRAVEAMDQVNDLYGEFTVTWASLVTLAT